ncbi:hypothetical protein BJ875DRAFT_504134 [Amylocarpus encephaloides]|uniref:SnoaL-like domain-containing protein n=1 Tax=Amylocarpus encephaloides TaxID=45428 RepID=A0A9P8C6J2_9HELO|nr:hypothetical protein BJ875DRAFT_504134 [Amylocarpus encephaloides]
MAQHSYASSYPSGIDVDSGIKHFFEDFYKTSDTPDVHDSYADAFTANATLIMASRKHVGREEILALRRSMWEKVSSRLHTPVKIFPFGAGSKELMLYGTVDYLLKDGRKAKVDWAAKANMVKDGEKWKMEFYQVYLDTAAQQNAK